jgi:hypothetical protein
MIQADLTSMDLKLELTDRLPHMSVDGDPGIDDPVNDTGLGPHRGDLHLSDEFACLLKMI